MIRKQKVYEVGTLVATMSAAFGVVDAFLEQCEVTWQTGIIIERVACTGALIGTTELYYTIRWDFGVVDRFEAKTLKARIKEGSFKILSEG